MGKLIRDPFRREHHLLCLCDTYNVDGTPALASFRHLAEKVFAEADVENTWFGIEQEYILYTVKSANMKFPIGWGKHGYNAPQGMYYCGVGAGYIYGRAVAEDHIRACTWAGLNIAGINAEVFPGQWEYQVGDWNGSGCHTNYSTDSTRDKATGWDTFMLYCDRLKTFHKEAMELYGTGNEQRMTGLHETAKFDEFTYGVGARNCSVRIGFEMKTNGCGYMEDRRPSSNIDPYLSVSVLADITVNNGKYTQEMVEAHKKFRNDMKFTYME